MSTLDRLRHVRRVASRRVQSRRSYSPDAQTTIVDGFHRLYYNEGVGAEGTWKNTRWLGIPVRKCPLDLWVYQEILVAVRPDIIVETGTGRGGSALFMACICDILGQGQIVTIDVNDRSDRPAHDRVTYLLGSSTAPEIRVEVERVVRAHPGAPTVMVILDSAHNAEHVLEELRSYHQLVSPGSYLIVEDTNVNGHPVEPGFGAGPTEAIEAFMSENDDFIVDTEMEKFHLTFNPGGYLKRRAEQEAAREGS